MNAILMMPVKLAICGLLKITVFKKALKSMTSARVHLCFTRFAIIISILLYNIIWFYYCIGIVAMVFLILNERMTQIILILVIEKFDD